MAFKIQDQTWIVAKFPESTFITEIQYSYLEKEGKRNSEIIRVDFKDGSVLEYRKPISFTKDIDFEAVFREFSIAPSVGKHWHKFIKGKFDYKKIR